MPIMQYHNPGDCTERVSLEFKQHYIQSWPDFHDLLHAFEAADLSIIYDRRSPEAFTKSRIPMVVPRFGSSSTLQSLGISLCPDTHVLCFSYHSFCSFRYLQQLYTVGQVGTPCLNTSQRLRQKLEQLKSNCTINFKSPTLLLKHSSTQLM